MPPIYDLKCIRCGHEFEFMKLKSDEIAICPKCDAAGKDLEIQVAKGVSFDFKGPNWAGKGKVGY
jgi:putative FmdB family regulatory protein